jgi:hypothetical protein
MESSESYDFDSVLRGMVTGLNSPYLIRGFDIVIPPSNIPPSSLVIKVSDSALLHSSATESGTILTVPLGTPDEVLGPSNSRVIGSFQNGTVNYLSLQYVRETDQNSADQTYSWSPTEKLELQRVVPTARILDYQFVISTTGFGTNLPLYIVGVNNGGTVDYITKSTPGLFRLGSGGVVPNPQNQYVYPTNPQTNDNQEWVNVSPIAPNPVSVVPGNPANAFNLGDWSITNLKQWMDAVMTRFRDLTGSSYWYRGSITNNETNNFNVWFDSAGSQLTGSGYLSYNYILETTGLIGGAFESSFTDSTILPGQSYVIGANSGRRATINSFNGRQLVVNTLQNTGFVVGEQLYNRREYIIDYGNFALDNYADTSFRYGIYQRISVGAVSPASISAWSYDATATVLQKVTITAAGHTFKPGDMVVISGLTGAANAPNGVFWIRETTSSTFSFLAMQPISGAATVAIASASKVTSSSHPYYPKFEFTSWAYSGTTITLTGFSQQPPIQSPVNLSGSTTSGSSTVTGLSSTASLKIGQRVTGTNVPSDTFVKSIPSGSSVILTKNATATGVDSLTFYDVIVVTGTTASTNAPNGRWNVTNVTTTGDIQFTVPSAPTGTAGINNAAFYPDYYQFLITVSDAVPATYNVVDVTAIADGPAGFYYPIGTSALPLQPQAGGSILFDGIIAISTVADPVRISTVQYNTGNLVITTGTPHGLSNNATATVTIYGDPLITGYAQTYQNVNLTVNSSTQFTIAPTPTSSPISFPNLGTYTNSGTDAVFLNFPNNPYAGPIQWSSDLVIKGVIGDKLFRIPQTATAAGTPLANRFNVNGVTGTAFLQDGQVAYIILKRNLPVSNGASFACATPGGPITGTNFLDENGNQLAAGNYGDFVKFEDEDESKWVRIGSFSGGGAVANLLSDNGQPPTPEQRPLKTGRLVYSKSTYQQIEVKPFYQVDPTTDVYWLAMRRDNGSQLSKVYVRGLQLELGEITQISDNQTNNLLIYTGAGNESAFNPNYTLIDQTGPWQLNESLTVTEVDVNTRTITFANPPQLNFQKGDKFTKTVGSTVYSFTINFVVSDVSVQVQQDVSVLSSSDTVLYYRLDYSIQDSDNLTLAARKEDRELAKINTLLSRPVYDESVYIQQINLSGSGTVRSGRYIYTGSISNPVGLAWVLHGTQDVSETIDNQTVTMPGGHPSIGSNAILVAILSNPSAFANGTAVNQIDMSTNTSVPTGRTINNPGNPAFNAPTIVGATGTGVQLVLPPNRRTQILGSGGGFDVWPANSYYKASSSSYLAGEDLLIIANDTIREANIDYEEVFGGPKAIIRLVRSMPVNTRIRFRTIATYGSVLAASSGGVSLQIAYNNGSVVNELGGNPVQLNAGDAASGGPALQLSGSLTINGDDGVGNIVGRIKGTSDKKFAIGLETNRPTEVWTQKELVKTQDSSPGSAWIKFTADQTTSTNTATNVLGSAVTVPEGSVMRICATGVAREASNAGQAAFRVEGVYTTVSGFTQNLGFPLSVIIGTGGNGSSYAMTFTVVGNQVLVVAYGDVTGVYWAFTIEYQIVASAS